MKDKYLLMLLSLLVSLFIYLFYRTEKTVVTSMFISVISYDNFIKLRESITAYLELNEHIINSLPEGLWVFCITITSKNLFIKIWNKKMNLIFMPLLFAIVLEFFQLFQITNGRFDFWDIGSSLFFWAIAYFFINEEDVQQNIFHPFTNRSLLCIFSYLIVYLAHVWS